MCWFHVDVHQFICNSLHHRHAIITSHQHFEVLKLITELGLYREDSMNTQLITLIPDPDSLMALLLLDKLDNAPPMTFHFSFLPRLNELHASDNIFDGR